MQGGKAEDVTSAEALAAAVHPKWKCPEKTEAFVKHRAVRQRKLYHPEKLPAASMQIAVPSPQSGYISHIQCDEIGVCSLILGGGRETKDSVIDLSVGLEHEKESRRLCRKR